MYYHIPLTLEYSRGIVVCGLCQRRLASLKALISSGLADPLDFLLLSSGPVRAGGRACLFVAGGRGCIQFVPMALIKVLLIYQAK